MSRLDAALARWNTVPAEHRAALVDGMRDASKARRVLLDIAERMPRSPAISELIKMSKAVIDAGEALIGLIDAASAPEPVSPETAAELASLMGGQK